MDLNRLIDRFFEVHVIESNDRDRSMSAIKKQQDELQTKLNNWEQIILNINQQTTSKGGEIVPISDDLKDQKDNENTAKIDPNIKNSDIALSLLKAKSLNKYIALERKLKHNFLGSSAIYQNLSSLLKVLDPSKTPMIEKLIISQILSRIRYEELPTSSNQSQSSTYYLFCFRLEQFLKDILCKPTNFKDLNGFVNHASELFEINFYSTNEIQEIMSQMISWIQSIDNPKISHSIEDFSQIGKLQNHKQLSLLDQLPDSKNYNTLKHFYNHFKNDYYFISILGVGAEAVVFKVFHRNKKEFRAIKLNYEQELERKEKIDLWSQNMKGKITCFGCEFFQKKFYAVMELGEESLLNYISRNRDDYSVVMGRDKLIEKLEIFIKILQSVESIHAHGVVHRDLDPKNIVKVDDQYKIIDFDTSKVIQSGDTITLQIGKESYMAPEVSENYYKNTGKVTHLLKSDHEKISPNITKSCDIFSLGIIFLKLLTDCSLLLSEAFVENAEFKDIPPYFTAHGLKFHIAVQTLAGEMKLHYAIGKLINECID